MKTQSDILKKRIAILKTDNRQLRRELVRHTRNEAVLQKRSDRYQKKWTESLSMHKDLRLLTHHMIMAQEDQRLHMSHELQDEIAQSLLGIHTNLLTMRRKTVNDTRALKDRIASTRKLVQHSGLAVQKATKKICSP